MKYFYSFFITLLICSNICAQDLIKNTRNGTQYASAKKSAQLNNIAKKVEETFKNTGYMTSKAFALQKNQQQLVAKNSKVVEDAVYFNLNKAEIAKIVQASPNSLKLQIPVTESNSIDLELIKNDFLAEGFEINTIEGEKFKLDENALFYKGIVNGDPSSIAAISIFDGDINGIISDKNGNYNLGSLKNKENQAILFNSKYSKSDKQFSCGGELLDDYYNNQQLKANKTEASAKKAENIACDTNDCVGVYFEVAEDLYDKLGSINAVVQYVTTVFNITSLVFENEQDVNGNSRAMKICLSSMFIWTKDDIYYGPKNIRITQFSKQLYNYDFPGAIAMVLSYIPGFSGGYANTGPFNCSRNRAYFWITTHTCLCLGAWWSII